MPAGVHIHCESSGAVLAPGCLAHPSRLSRGEAVLAGWDISPLPGMKGWVTRDKLGSPLSMGVRVSPCTGQRGMEAGVKRKTVPLPKCWLVTLVTSQSAPALALVP